LADAVSCSDEGEASELHARRKAAVTVAESAVMLTREDVVKNFECFIGQAHYHPRSSADARDLLGTAMERARPSSAKLCMCVALQ
jgi:hypothetical protein